MKKFAAEWTEGVLMKMAKSKRANAGGMGSLVVMALPTLMEKLALSGDPTTGQIVIGALVGLFIWSQGQADHGKEASLAGLKRDVLSSLLTQGSVISPVQDLEKVLKAAGMTSQEALELVQAVAGNPVASGDLERTVADKLPPAGQ